MRFGQDGIIDVIPFAARAADYREMVLGTGFEPVESILKACADFVAFVSAETADHNCAHKSSAISK